MQSSKDAGGTCCLFTGGFRAVRRPPFVCAAVAEKCVP